MARSGARRSCATRIGEGAHLGGGFLELRAGVAGFLLGTVRANDLADEAGKNSRQEGQTQQAAEGLDDDAAPARDVELLQA